MAAAAGEAAADQLLLVTTVFIHSAVFGVGQGAGAPVIVLIARDLGASVGVPDPPRAHDAIPGGVALGTILRQPE